MSRSLFEHTILIQFY